MDWQTLSYLVPYIFSVMISTGVGVYVWRRRGVAGATAYAWVALSQASWTLGYIFELVSSSLEDKLFWDNLQWVGVAGWLLAFFAFSLQYTRRELSHPKRTWGLLAIVPVVFLLLVFTDDRHGLIHPTAWLVPGEPFSALVYDFTMPVWVGTLYFYGLFLAGMAILVARYIRPHRLYRAQVGTIILGTFIPLVGTVLTLAGITLTFQRDTTPFTFALSNLIVAWGLFRYRLFDIVPVAHDRVFESMSDSVIVLDAQDRVVDLNPAAQQVIGLAASKIVGQPVEQVLSPWSDLVEWYRDGEEARREIVVDAAEGQQYFDLSFSPLRDRHDHLVGRLIVIHDITESKRAEEALQKAHDELEQRVAERTAELARVNVDLRTEITKRKQMEEELRQSERKFRDIARNIPGMVYQSRVRGDGTSYFSYASPRAGELFGLPHDLEDPDWELGSHLHPEDREEFFASIGQAIENRADWNYEGRILMPGGDVKWFQGISSPIPVGEELVFNGILLNITERKHAEETLREREETIRALVETSQDWIWSIDVQGIHTYCNPAIEAILGYRPEELVGKQSLDLIHPEDRVRIEASLREWTQAKQGWNNQLIRWQHKDGSYRYLESNAVPILDAESKLLGFRGMDRDITERKRAEQALRESQKRFQALAAATFEGIGFSKQGVVIDANQQFASMLGYEMNELLGLQVHKMVVPEDRELVQHRMLAGSEAPYEHRALCKDGTIIFVEVRPRMLSIEGRPVRVTAVRDITERKQAEEALQRYAERLKILHEIDQGILSAQSPEAIAQAALSRIRQLIPCQRADVSLFDFTTNEAVVLAVDVEAETKFKVGTRIGLDQFEDEIKPLRQGKVIMYENLQPGDRILKTLNAEGIHSIMVVPLTSQGEAIGSLNLGATDPSIFTEEHETVGRQVADQLAIAIQQTQLREQIQHYAEELEQRVVDRTQELSVLYEVTAIASESLDLRTALARSLDRVLVALKSHSGVIHLLDEDDETAGEKWLNLIVQQGLRPGLVAQIDSMPTDEGLGAQVIEQGEPLIVPDVASDPRAAEISYVGSSYTYVGLPMRASGGVVGVLTIFREDTSPQFNVEEMTLLASIADQIGVVVESARLRQQAEQAAVMEERARLARELHDSVSQLLYSINLFAKSGRNAYHLGHLDELNECLTELGENAQQALKEMRLLVYELRPPVLEQEGLISALQHRLDTVEGRVGVTTQLLTGKMIELPEQIAVELYHIALEALNNALKYAKATSVTVKLDADHGERIQLEIIDNGAGFDFETVEGKGGLGLVTMRERAEKLGGRLTITSAPGAGTTVKVSVEAGRSEGGT